MSDGRQEKMLIGGEWVEATGGGRFSVSDPATDRVVGSVPDGGALECSVAIEAAAEALPDWRARPAEERARSVARLAELMRRDREDLAALMTAEQGKSLREARGEIDYALSFFEWAAGEGPRVLGDVVPASKPGKRIAAIRQGVGVCGAITPWNFPSAMITRKLGPALACGCTMVIKPAELTPLSAIAIGKLCVEAELPPGVVNIVTGDAEAIGKELFKHDEVRKVSFTGSTEVGSELIRLSAERVINLSLELGGHAPLIVFDDADFDLAVQQAVAAKFRATGQSCISPNRFYIQSGLYDRFRDAVVREVEKVVVGVGTEEGVDIGPLINDAAIDKVERHVEDARKRGAAIPCGGHRVQPRGGLADRFYAPTVIDGFTQEMTLAREETFGPVMPLQKFDTEEEAIRLANDSVYGLAAYFFTENVARCMRVAEALDYGIVGVNDGLPSTAQAPFGGVKRSGYGREGGRYVMDEYTEWKYLSFNIERENA